MNGKHKEILLIAQEECAEVTQAISKVFRFGIDATHNDKSNRERLCEEVGDLLCMIELMIVNKIISSDDVDEARKHKLAKLKTWSNIFGEKNE
jgi:NTP pyrophosphatase (non-canonical NTP hydrolase)